MKQSAVLTLLLLMATIHVAAQNDDEERIKKTIQAETDALKSNNVNAFKETWISDPNSFYAFFSRTGYNRTSIDSIVASVGRGEIKSNPDIVENDQNFNIRVKGDLAWVQYDHLSTPANADSTIYPYSSMSRYHAYRVMEKDNNEWKTVSYINTLPQSYGVNDHSIESDLNEVGYALLRQKKFNEAIEALRLNVKLFPKSFNVYDSLAEAYAAAGNKPLAIQNYEKSIEMNPGNTNGKEMLVKLKTK